MKKEIDDGRLACAFSHNMPDNTGAFKILGNIASKSLTTFRERQAMVQKYRKILQDALKRDQDPSLHGQIFPERKTSKEFEERLLDLTTDVGKKFVRQRDRISNYVNKNSIENIKRKFSKHFIVLCERIDVDRPVSSGPRFIIWAQDPYSHRGQELGKSYESLEDCYRSVLYKFTLEVENSKNK